MPSPPVLCCPCIVFGCLSYAAPLSCFLPVLYMSRVWLPVLCNPTFMLLSCPVHVLCLVACFMQPPPCFFCLSCPCFVFGCLSCAASHFCFLPVLSMSRVWLPVLCSPTLMLLLACPAHVSCLVACLVQPHSHASSCLSCSCLVFGCLSFAAPLSCFLPVQSRPWLIFNCLP